MFPFAPISMPCRYSLNKKQRKKGKKAKPVRYISTCVQTEKLFGNYTVLIDVINMFVFVCFLTFCILGESEDKSISL